MGEVKRLTGVGALLIGQRRFQGVCYQLVLKVNPAEGKTVVARLWGNPLGLQAASKGGAMLELQDGDVVELSAIRFSEVAEATVIRRVPRDGLGGQG